MTNAVVIRDQSYIKYRNIQTVLTLLAENQPISRTEIVRMTEMSPTSITRITNALLTLGLVVETHADLGAGRGRKAMNLATRADGIYAAGISLEPHRVRLGLVDFRNTLLHACETPISDAAERTPEALAQLSAAALEHLCAEAAVEPSRIRAVGVCAAGPVDCQTGVVIKSDQMHWQNARVGEAFSAAFRLPTYVENDVKACLLGEKALRGIPEHEDTAYLLIGTGVGLAITANGKLVRGYRNEAGEIDGIPTGSGGTLADHLVGTAILRRARQVEPYVQTVEDIIAAYRQEIPWAKMLIGDFRRAFQMVIRIIEGVCDPRHIILGGSIVPTLGGLLQVEACGTRIQIGGDYGNACIAGAAIIAQRQAVQTLITEELNA